MFVWDIRRLIFSGNNSGIFLGLIWGRILAPFPIRKWEKSSQNGVYHFQFFSSTFWWKIHENPNKNTKVTDAWNFEKQYYGKCSKITNTKK